MALMRCRLRFAWAMMAALVCLWRYRWALGDGEGGPVMQRFEGIRGEMRRWIPEIS